MMPFKQDMYIATISLETIFCIRIQYSTMSTSKHTVESLKFTSIEFLNSLSLQGEFYVSMQNILIVKIMHIMILV